MPLKHPSVEEVFQERQRSGDGIEQCRRRLMKQSALRALETAQTVEDLKPILLWILKDAS